MSEPILPQELIDTIIDYLFDDSHTLCNCSLVSQAWVERCRHHLYGELSINVTSRFPTKRPIAPSKLSDILTESPHLTPYIRSLHIGPFIPRGPKAENTASTAEAWAATRLVLPRLSHVQRLSIRGPHSEQGHTISQDEWNELEASIRNWSLTHLALSGKIRFHLNDLSSLQWLLVNGQYCDLKLDLSNECKPQVAKPQLSELRVVNLDRTPDINDPSNFFGPNSPVDLSCLRVLFITGSYEPTSNFGSKMVQRVASTLEVLCLHAMIETLPLDFTRGEKVATFPFMPRLHTLELRSACDPKHVYPENQDSVDWLIGMLNSVPPTSVIRTIILNLDFDLSMSNMFNWNDMGAALMRIHGFGKLREVRIKIAPLGALSILEDLLCLKFGDELKQSGLVKIEAVSRRGSVSFDKSFSQGCM